MQKLYYIYKFIKTKFSVVSSFLNFLEIKKQTVLPAIQFYKDEVISHCSCWLQSTLKGIQDEELRVRHSVLWKNKQNMFLLIFQRKTFFIEIWFLHLSIVWKALKSLSHLFLLSNSNWDVCWVACPPSPERYKRLASRPISLKWFLRAIWEAVSQATVRSRNKRATVLTMCIFFNWQDITIIYHSISLRYIA